MHKICQIANYNIVEKLLHLLLVQSNNEIEEKLLMLIDLIRIWYEPNLLLCWLECETTSHHFFGLYHYRNIIFLMVVEYTHQTEKMFWMKNEQNEIEWLCNCFTRLYFKNRNLIYNRKLKCHGTRRKLNCLILTQVAIQNPHQNWEDICTWSIIQLIKRLE